MKFILIKTSDRYTGDTIEVNTLEELIQFVKEQSKDVIIYEDYDDKDKMVIEIYDDFRE